MRFRGIVWIVLVVLMLLALIAFFLTPDRSQVQRFENLPWQIEIIAEDHTRVLGIELGQTTLMELAGRLPVPDIRLFVEPDGTRTVEAFYANARIPPFEANLVLVPDLDEDGMAFIWEERTSERPMPSGARRYGLSDDALRALGRTPAVEMSYIPRARWDSTLLRERFGDPAGHLRIGDDQEYWLYPDVGLAIMVPIGRGRVLMHYVTMERWETVLERLEQAGERLLEAAGGGAS
ncbi:hypothetical protein [Thioalkalivibrio sp.]|uniref:hypothetical protein n=1 Tax=Thioalkalivibrio sp. TaxID=2093813 RepID=UPI0012D5A6DC|nr:hypothetical protein [Thioalkalivibrio sp.]TVP80048.1 MAG: hypothetical protein EA346_08400 [Thioalkalivibrio sp.]